MTERAHRILRIVVLHGVEDFEPDMGPGFLPFNAPAPPHGGITAIESDESGFAGRYLGREEGTCIHAGRQGGFRPAPRRSHPVLRRALGGRRLRWLFLGR